MKLAGSNRPIALAEANAMLSRVDLLCEVIKPPKFSIFPLIQFLVFDGEFKSGYWLKSGPFLGFCR